MRRPGTVRCSRLRQQPLLGLRALLTRRAAPRPARRGTALLALGLAALAAPPGLAAPVIHVSPEPALGRADAVIDLATTEGARLVQAAWRYADAPVVEAEGRAVGPDLRPSGAPLRTFDLGVRAGAAAFDDSAWEVIAPESLDRRRATGKLCFGWYRTRVTVPPRVGAVDPTGATLVFEVVVDDYAEVWVDGRLGAVLGQRGGAVVAGFNAPNRVVLTRDARPGQQFTLAVLGANGPLSASPGNFLWVKSATLEVHRPPSAPPKSYGQVLRKDPALDAIVPPGAVIEKLADGFSFTEGPVWHPGGYLLFSDPNDNVIYRYDPEGRVSVYRTKSGYKGLDIGEYGQPGSNGLTLDREGRLVIDEHGNRRVTRLEKNGQLTVLADRYQGHRLNSPNDLVYRSDGVLYFTDPPFGLPRFFDDPRKELPYSGVFALVGTQLKLVARELTGPNGIAFSPDEKHLYVSNWDPARKVILRYDVRADGTLAGARTFFDMGGAPGEEALDGLKVDQRGNVYASGPGGVWIISPEGHHLGTLQISELPANFAWGDPDGQALYLTARTSLYRIRLSLPGLRPNPPTP